jgi:PTH1 family peptidyl-tRNA hydrolase
MSVKLVVGLGNYPLEYADTRHNVGFMVVDEICQQLSITLDQDKFKGLFTQIKTDKDTIILAKPQTLMNLSGDFVRDVCHFYKITPQDVLVISDDVDLKVGTLRIKINGSSGGQNGIKDIINKLGTENIARMKLGIGRPENSNIALANHVLSKFTNNDKALISPIIHKAAMAAIEYMNGSTFTFLMNKYNLNLK